ncbi:MAG: hypothetical protein JWO32_1756, partial [Bacteroidetes bacterium]|nr:hypothetical protein [Bacteroidota bacterium]
MKKLFTSIICFTGLTSILAQPVLNYDVSHSIGTKSIMYLIGGTTTSLQQSGAAVTWNLSSNTLTPSGYFDMVDPATTPYASTYPAANLSFAMNITGQGTSYSYLIDSPTELNAIADGIGGSNPTIWSQYDKLVKYPFNYTSSFTATRQPSTGPVEPYTRTEDAYGTLTINSKTYNNVIRVIKNPGNSIWFTTSPVLFPIVIQANSSTYLYNEPTTFTGVNDKKAAGAEVTIYPNPVKDRLNIQFEDFTFSKETKLLVFNIFGETIKQCS